MADSSRLCFPGSWRAVFCLGLANKRHWQETGGWKGEAGAFLTFSLLGAASLIATTSPVCQAAFPGVYLPAEQLWFLGSSKITFSQ